MPSMSKAGNPSLDRSTNEPSPALLRGRACYAHNEWNDAFVALAEADDALPLDTEDLERLALSAGLTARDDQMLATQERLYYAYLGAGADLAAARSAFWLGFRLQSRAEFGQATIG